MRRQFAKLACIVAVCAGMPAVAYGQGGTLRYRWVEGEQMRYRQTQESSMTMSGLPGFDGAVVTQKMVQIMRVTVEKVTADGSVTLRETFESVRMEQNTPMGSTVFDSTSPAKPDQPPSPVDSVMSAMIGESITLVLAPDGKVSKVEGMSRIMDKMFASLPQDPLSSQVLGQLKASMSDESFGSAFGQTFATFPNRALKAGDTWSDQAQANNPIAGRLTTATTYTVKSIDSANGSTIARIAQAQTIKQEAGPEAASPFSALGMTMKLGESKSQGEILFDITSGRLQKTALESDMPMTMSLKDSPLGSLDVTGSVRTIVLMELLQK